MGGLIGLFEPVMHVENLYEEPEVCGPLISQLLVLQWRTRATGVMLEDYSAFN